MFQKITHTVKQKAQICAELNVVSFVQGKNSMVVIFEDGENFSVEVCVLIFLLKFVVVCIKIPVAVSSSFPLYIVLVLNALLDFTNLFEI